MGIADGKRALVVGVANEKSLAWGIAQELKAQGAEDRAHLPGRGAGAAGAPARRIDRRAGGRRA